MQTTKTTFLADLQHFLTVLDIPFHPAWLKGRLDLAEFHVATSKITQLLDLMNLENMTIQPPLAALTQIPLPALAFLKNGRLLNLEHV